MLLTPWFAAPLAYSAVTFAFRWLGWELRAAEERSDWLSRTALRLIVTAACDCASSGWLPVLIALASCTATYRHNVIGRAPAVDAADKMGSVLVTGSTAGIGRAAAIELARLGCDVIVTARDAAKAQRTADEIARESKGRVFNLVVDRGLELSCQRSVREYAAELKRQLNKSDVKPLSVLILNAGVMRPTFGLSVDDAELTIASNHLGHHTLTVELLPLLEDAAARGFDARVVVVASALHAYAANSKNIDDFEAKKWRYSLFEAYARSKLVNVLWARELNQRLEGAVTCVSLHPGIVYTSVTRSLPLLVRLSHLAFMPVMIFFQKTPGLGARTTVHAALAGEGKARGGYLADCRFIEPEFSDSDLGRKIWTASELHRKNAAN